MGKGGGAEFNLLKIILRRLFVDDNRFGTEVLTVVISFATESTDLCLGGSVVDSFLFSLIFARVLSSCIRADSRAALIDLFFCFATAAEVPVSAVFSSAVVSTSDFSTTGFEIVFSV